MAAETGTTVRSVQIAKIERVIRAYSDGRRSAEFIRQSDHTQLCKVSPTGIGGAYEFYIRGMAFDPIEAGEISISLAMAIEWVTLEVARLEQERG